MTLTALRLGNFKAFADTQEVPIRPITLIFGPNSAGKSSIIHSLALVHHALFSRTGDLDAHRTEIGGDSIDLGGFGQYVYGRDRSRRVEYGFELNTAELSGTYQVMRKRSPREGLEEARRLKSEFDEGR